MNPPAGRCYWAVAPFSPEPPFRIYADGAAPIEVDSAHKMQTAAARGGSEFTVLTSVKVRPVLVVSEILSPFDEVLALRLKRLSTLSEDQARAVREGQDDRLFYLDPEAMEGLELENAAIVTSLLKLPVGALDTTAELGSINEGELRVLHQSIADSNGLRLDLPVLERALDLIAKLAERDAGD